MLHVSANRLFTRVLRSATCGASRGSLRQRESIATGHGAIDQDDRQPGPLGGVRVLDLTRIVAGPYCTMLLADLGAEVIKVERPGGGDEARKWGPPWANASNESCYFLPVNRNKYSVCIDIKSTRGRDLIRSIAKDADVLVENYVPGKLTEMGLGFEDLKELAPQLIYCSITGYGNEGPYKNMPGYDVIAASRGGLLHITGPAGGEPAKVGVALTDVATGLYAHGAIMAALLHRQRDGQGQHINVDLLSTQLACLINVGSNYLNAQQDGKRWGTAHASIVPYQAFKTQDGYYTLGTGSDAQFVDFCALIHKPELAEMAEYKTNKDRVVNRDALIRIISEILATKTNKEWERIFLKASFPNGPVNSIRDAFDDQHVKAINIVQEIEHPTAGTVKVVGPAVKYSKSRNDVRMAPPIVGQHTDVVLKHILKFDEDKINELRKLKVIQ